jgi:uncharacterized membrane protein
MTVTRALSIYAVTLLIFFAIDLVWLGVVANSSYRQHLGHLLSPQVNWGAATLRDWPVIVTVVDLAWGPVLSASVAYLSYQATVRAL